MDSQIELDQEATETPPPDENTPDTTAISREERLRFAVADRKAGMLLKEVARKWNVNYKAVQRLQENPNLPLCQPLKVLTRAEEKSLADWIDGCAARGYPRARADIMEEAHDMLKIRNGENVEKPSYKWLSGFCDRQKLSFRKAASVTKAAANVSEADIKTHFVRIEEALKKEGCDDLLMLSNRVLNADESCFHINPSTGAVCFKSGTRHAQRVVKDEKAGITMMLTIRADGKKMKPFFVYPQLQISKVIDSSFPHGRATRTGTESGWMKGEAFCEFLRNIAIELTEDGIDLPNAKVILFVDNYGSHLKLECCRLARQLGIIMVSLYPNTTHMTQPCDVSCFRSLKSAWRAKSAELKRQKMDTSITKVTIAKLLTELVEELPAKIVINGFKKCGMFPWDPTAVDYKKCIAISTSLNISATSTTPEDEPIVFDLTDDSSSNIVNEKNLLDLLSGKLPLDMFHQISKELARQKLVSFYSPEQDSTLCSTPAAVPETHATPLPPTPRREGKRVTKRTSPVLSSIENIEKLSQKVKETEKVAVNKKERAKKTSENQKRKAHELLGKSAINAKKAGLHSSSVSTFQLLPFEAPQHCSSSFYETSISSSSHDFFNTSFISSLIPDRMSTTVENNEPPAKLAKVESVKIGKGGPADENDIMMKKMEDFMAASLMRQEQQTKRKQEMKDYKFKDCTNLSNKELSQSVRDFAPTIKKLFISASSCNKKFNSVLMTTGNILTDLQLEFVLNEIENQRPVSERGSKDDVLTEIILPELIMYLFCQKFELSIEQALDALNVQEEYTMLHLTDNKDEGPNKLKKTPKSCNKQPTKLAIESVKRGRGRPRKNNT